MIKYFLLVAIVAFSIPAFSADLVVNNATVTRVQVYEKTDDTVQVWLHLNGNSRVGPNPDNPVETCELWTYDKSVYSSALAALMSGKKVSVTYVDRGEGTYWCNVRHFSVLAN
ncbi:MAG: hypothetical protein K6L80_12085 [Agarilytica sp.]